MPCAGPGAASLSLPPPLAGPAQHFRRPHLQAPSARPAHLYALVGWTHQLDVGAPLNVIPGACLCPGRQWRAGQAVSEGAKLFASCWRRSRADPLHSHREATAWRACRGAAAHAGPGMLTGKSQ